MTQHQAATERVVNIIARIKMGRKSGQLTIKRGEGLAAEEGRLTFVQGQVTEAHVERRNGSDALNWLSTWGKAWYTFIPTTSEEENPAFFAPSSTLDEQTKASSEAEQINTNKRVPARSSDRISSVPHTTEPLPKAMAQIERTGLSRGHRRLYLLIDGHRSIADLLPLTGKNAVEIQNMLHDLEWIGVIHFARP